MFLVVKEGNEQSWFSCHQVRPVQLIGASATVNDELKEDLSELGWGDHVTVIQSPSFEGKRRTIPSCIKHQFVVFDDSFGGTKAQTLARYCLVLN